jgi:hypothetical protein
VDDRHHEVQKARHELAQAPAERVPFLVIGNLLGKSGETVHGMTH